MSINKQALKPGKYAILFRNNWDGEGDTYDVLAILDDELVWRDEDGKELLEYEGDAVLKAWPMDDGSNLLALLDELEAADALNKHLELAIRKAEGCSEALRRKTEAAENRIAELESERDKQGRHACELFDEVATQRKQIAELVAAGIITKVGE